MSEVSTPTSVPPHLRRGPQRPRIGSDPSSSSQVSQADMGVKSMGTQDAVPEVTSSGFRAGSSKPEPLKTARNVSAASKGINWGAKDATFEASNLASPTISNGPTTGGDSWDGGVLLQEAVDYDSESKASKSSAANNSEMGESLGSPLSPSFFEAHANKPVKSKSENVQRVPPHLRWTLKEKGVQSTGARTLDDSAAGSSRWFSESNSAGARGSPSHRSTAEISRAKEQARLDDRTGVAKTKASKGKEVAVVKYEGNSTRNATLAAAKENKPYPCTIKDCPAGFRTETELHKHKSERHKYCKRCKQWFENTDMLHLHKLADADHIACHHCSVDFYTNEALEVHMKQNHPVDQAIPCTGCGKKFVRAAGIVDHIEKGHCEVITPYKLHLARAEKTAEFIKEKNSIQPSPANHVTADDEPMLVQRQLTYPNILDDDDESIKGSIRPLHPELPIRETQGVLRELPNLEEWPALGNVLGSAASTQPGTVRKPAAAGAKFPPEARRIDNPNQKFTVPLENRCTYRNAAGQIVFDPYDPVGNCGQFRNYEGKYKCYVATCGKSFATEIGFRSHLTSQIHQGLEYTCNACLKNFNSATALTAHLESASTRCSVKQSADYSRTVGMASGGLVNVRAFDARGNVIFGGATAKERETLTLEAAHDTRW